MDDGLIEGVEVRPLARFADERGTVMRMVRRDDADFDGFGEVYFSSAYPGAIKGWHVHARNELNYAAVCGTVKLVLWDGRPDSASHERVNVLVLGPDNCCRVRIPPGVWTSWTPLGGGPATVVNCMAELYDPAEMTSADPFGDAVPYRWARP